MCDLEYYNLKVDDILLIWEGIYVIYVLGGCFFVGSIVISGLIGDWLIDFYLWDIEFNDGNELSLRLDLGFNVLLYVYEGKFSVNGEFLFMY